MKKTETLNNVSDSLLKKTKLKRDETVVYRVKAVYRNPVDPNEILIPAATNVPVIDQIWDEEKGEYVDIAAISRISKDGNHSYHDIWFYGAFGGYMMLKGSVAADQEVHSYLMLSNYNASNPNRDTSKPEIYELVDESAKAQSETKMRNMRREALNAAADLSVDDLKNFTAALGRDDNRKADILRNELEAFADHDPKGFLELINNKQAAMKATINRALAKNVIRFSPEQSMFTWENGEAILTVARSTGSDAVDELISFCISSPKGEKVFQTIQSKAKK